MNDHDLFTWANFQTSIIGAILGLVRALSSPTPGFVQFICVMLVAGFAGGAAAVVFGPMLSQGIVWLFGDRIPERTVWLFSSGFMGATGITCIPYIGVIGGAIVDRVKSIVGRQP